MEQTLIFMAAFVETCFITNWELSPPHTQVTERSCCYFNQSKHQPKTMVNNELKDVLLYKRWLFTSLKFTALLYGGVGAIVHCL